MRVSGEAMNVREIYKNVERMETTCKLIFLTNHLPEFRKGTSAEEHRLRILHFKVKPDLPNVELKDELQKEASGIFNWMLEGLRDLLEARKIPYGGEASMEMTEQFRQTNDLIKVFLEDKCQLSPHDETSKEELLQAFCEHHGGKPDIWRVRFHRRVKALYPLLGETRRMGIHARERFYVGLKLKP